MKMHSFDLGTKPHNNEHSCYIDILIVDDQNSIRQRLQLLLEQEPDLNIVGAAEDGSTAIKQIEFLQPNIVIVDIEMPGMDGIKATRIISKRFSECKVIVFSSYDSQEYIERSLQAGAKGYILKDAPAKEIVDATRSVYKGCTYLSSGILEKFLSTKSSIVIQKSKHLSELPTERQLVHQDSEELLHSPEGLNQLLRVVNPKGWLSLCTLCFIVTCTFIWSVFGKLPVTIEGRGILVYPKKVVQLQSGITGRIKTLNVEEGEFIRKGDVVATIDRVDLLQELKFAKAELEQLNIQNEKANALQSKRKKQDLKLIQQQQKTSKQKFKNLQQVSPTSINKSLIAIKRNQETQQIRLQRLVKILPMLLSRLKNREKLFKQGAISQDSLIEAQEKYMDQRTEIDEVQYKLKQLDVEEADARQKYLFNLNEINDIKAQLQELSSKKANIAQEDLETSINRQKEVQNTERKIANLQEQFKNDSRIVSQYSGRILEITVNSGQYIDENTRLANINTKNSAKELVGINYFSVKDGYRIQQKMDIQITPQTTNKESFGGIIGTIAKISSFPITQESAVNKVGSKEIVEGLVPDRGNGIIEVVTTLKKTPQTFSGYEWSSSSGPRFNIAPGTTTNARVKIEEKAPITFVLPFLRSVSGI